MVTNVAFTELDFARNKAALKEYLRSQDQFKDYDFEGSNINVLLDILSYNTFLNNYYVHAMFSEMFIDTAQLRENMNSHAKELNYLPQSRQSSTAVVNVNIAVPQMINPPTFITIPRNTQFLGKCNGVTYTFYNKESVNVFPVNGVYQYRNLKIYEGKIITETYNVDDAQSRRYILNTDIADVDSLRIFVRDNIKADSTTVEFVRRNDVFGVKSDDEVYYLSPYLKHRYEVYFGRDTLGREPMHGNVITMEYRATVGEDANGVKVFQPASRIGGFDASCTTVQYSEAGKERESIEDIRFYAPRYVQIQQRTVTESDYGILLKNEFSEIQDVAVYGGEKADPPQYGRVIVAVDIENTDGVTFAERQKFYNFLKDRCPLAIEPVIEAARFMYVELVTSVTYNTTMTSMSSADIENIVKDAITQYSDDYLNKFGQIVRTSKITKAIDDSDNNIVSNDTKVRAILEYTPSLLSEESFDLRFENALNYDHGAYADHHHYPAIQSSKFTYDGYECYMIDDGEGNINIVTSELNSVGYSMQTIKEKIGTVNYTDGLVTITRFQPTAYSGNTIKFYANLMTRDIFTPDNRIIYIRDEDISISVLTTRD